MAREKSYCYGKEIRERIKQEYKSGKKSVINLMFKYNLSRSTVQRYIYGYAQAKKGKGEERE